MKRIFMLLISSMLLIVALAACGGDSSEGGETTEVEVTRIVEVNASEDILAAVRERDVLKCGGNKSVPGFGFLNEDGSFEGFDIDYCRAVAAAIFGDAGKVEIRATTASERFPLLQTGEIDLLIRNTTWTISRDTSLGLDFAPTTFYDGQGMMVRKDSGITSLEDMDGSTVCVQAGTTTEKNLADVFRARGIDFEPKVFPDADTTKEAYDSGSCDGFTTDKSGLVSQQILLSEPDAHTILDETMSKEPLGPVVRHGDNNFGDIVVWTVNCTIQAEELGITSANVDDFLGGDDPVVQNLLGESGDLGQAMGLDNNFCYNVIKEVGNYGEIYDRNLGPDTPFNLPRGLNNLWTEGGLLYSPPFR